MGGPLMERSHGQQAALMWPLRACVRVAGQALYRKHRRHLLPKMFLEVLLP